MKLCVFLIALACVSGTFGDILDCSVNVNITTEWNKMGNTCVGKMIDQVRKEIDAALEYFKLGAYFARDVIDRPGFSKFFFESASEEREHAMKLIEYMLMRGTFIKKEDKQEDRKHFPLSRLLTPSYFYNKDTIQTRSSEQKGIDAQIEDGIFSGKQALEYALNLEIKVTESINDIIKTCEEQKDLAKNKNDYHLVDYLINEFLDEQHKGQRDIAGKIAVLGKMIGTHKELGEFLFDKKMLHGEV